MSSPSTGVSIVAVDTGGTFTDVVALTDGALTVLKVPSTPDDPARAVLDGIRAALSPGRAFVLIHGSTVATNTLLERTGARVALVTNRGFEDVIEIGRQNRPQLYAVVGHRPPPLVARDDRHGIAGRLGPDGGEIEPLDPDDLAALPARLAGADAIAVCLLHSYARPDHEERVAAALGGTGIPLSVSARLLPEYREYERTATTVVNAYIAPRMDRYLGRLAEAAGAARVRIMGSGGGAIPVERARREPVHTVLSGPAGGVAGALEVAAQAGVRDILTFDMGGTSTDVSLCPGEPLHTREFTIAGLPVAVPVLDIHTVGAGGGSIAEVDAGGALRVGPRSAGADPGPICYGRGGRRVTVTDAHAWLGRLPADVFLGGAAPLDRSAIEAPLRELAAAIGTDPDAAAEGILAVADTAMEGALRVISVERGHDPADFTLVPFGGAAGLHAAELAERLGVAAILVPPDPGVLSAYGMLASPVRKDAARSVLLRDDAPAARVEAVFEALEAEALAAMEAEGVAAAAVTLRRFADARYVGQSFELRVPARDWVAAFHGAHAARYGFDRRAAAVELVTARVEATGPLPDLRAGRAAVAATRADPPARRPEGERTGRVVYRRERLDARVVARAALAAGATMAGPAVVHEYSATTWVPPGWTAEALESGSLSLRRALR
ncbi:MAG TPA: hydantoinase/oxoprolinase family protein [Longimicrobiales bacterium]|nr:hydantoinase/oxoprolinase family protein [Longimicrobiales bacterium]